MSQFKYRHLPLALAAMVACMSAHAGGYTSEDGKFSLSGFGTLGAVKLDTDEAKFNYKGQRGGAGNEFSLNPDSKIAAQGTYKFTPTVSFTAQLMSKFDAEAQYTPSVEWAFAKWQALPSLALRVGRMGAPLFMISDFREVNYANLWVRTPLDVYGQVPFSSFNGADASYQTSVGDTTLSASIFAGRADTKYSLSDITNPSKVILNNMRGINLQAEFDGGVTLRIGHTQGKLKVESDTTETLAAYAALCAPAAPCAETQALLTASGADASFTGVGLSLDRGNWLASLEYTKRKTDSYISDTTGWYASAGYRIGKFTPYLAVSKISVDKGHTNPLLGTPYAAAAFSPYVTAFLATQNTEQRTTSLGVRWDVLSNVAVKAQWDRIVKPADSLGMFYMNETVGSDFYDNKQTVNAVSLSVDFVF